VRRQKNTNSQIRTLPMVQHRIKPPHGLWLIAGDHYDAPNGLPAFAGRLNVSRIPASAARTVETAGP
jgi:hypothetical protein